MDIRHCPKKETIEVYGMHHDEKRALQAPENGLNVMSLLFLGPLPFSAGLLKTGLKLCFTDSTSERSGDVLELKDWSGEKIY